MEAAVEFEKCKQSHKKPHALTNGRYEVRSTCADYGRGRLHCTNPCPVLAHPTIKLLRSNGRSESKQPGPRQSFLVQSISTLQQRLPCDSITTTRASRFELTRNSNANQKPKSKSIHNPFNSRGHAIAATISQHIYPSWRLQRSPPRRRRTPPKSTSSHSKAAQSSWPNLYVLAPRASVHSSRIGADKNRKSPKLTRSFKSAVPILHSHDPLPARRLSSRRLPSSQEVWA